MEGRQLSDEQQDGICALLEGIPGSGSMWEGLLNQIPGIWASGGECPGSGVKRQNGSLPALEEERSLGGRVLGGRRETRRSRVPEARAGRDHQRLPRR